jgi:hypothetical protein
MSTEISITLDNSLISTPRAIGLALSAVAIGACIATRQMPALTLQELQTASLVSAVALPALTALPELYRSLKWSLQNHFNIALPITLGATMYSTIKIVPIALRFAEIISGSFQKA